MIFLQRISRGSAEDEQRVLCRELFLGFVPFSIISFLRFVDNGARLVGCCLHRSSPRVSFVSVDRVIGELQRRRSIGDVRTCAGLFIAVVYQKHLQAGCGVYEVYDFIFCQCPFSRVQLFLSGPSSSSHVGASLFYFIWKWRAAILPFIAHLPHFPCSSHALPMLYRSRWDGGVVTQFPTVPVKMLQVSLETRGIQMICQILRQSRIWVNVKWLPQLVDGISS